MMLKWDTNCKRCGGFMAKGSIGFWSNVPSARGMYHVDKGCAGATNTTGQAETVPTIAPEPTIAVESPKVAPGDAVAGDNGILDGLAEYVAARVKPSMDADAVKALVATEVPQYLSPEKIQTLIDDAVAKVLPQTVELHRQDGTVVKVEGAHYLFPRVVKLLSAGIDVILTGPAGTGKTTCGLMAAEYLGKTASEIDTLDPSTPKSAVLGYRNPVMVTPELVRDKALLAEVMDAAKAETAFTRCYANGQIYIGDEIDNAPAHVQSVLNSALANGHAPAAWGMVKRGEGFGGCFTANTVGLGPTDAFPDRKPMSAAFRDRLYFVHFPLDPNVENRAAGLPLQRTPRREEATCTPQAWATWVKGIRAWAEQNMPKLQVTPRATIVGLRALAAGETPAEVAHGLVFRGADKAMVAKALAAVPLPE